MHSILVVDDSASMRQMLSFTLKNAGFVVVLAVDGQDAWEKAGQRDFSLVLTDQNMPRMDGIELAKKLRGDPRFKTTPIVFSVWRGEYCIGYTKPNPGNPQRSIFRKDAARLIESSIPSGCRWIFNTSTPAELLHTVNSLLKPGPL